ncbi:MAG: glycine cleavage system aminomethyltransferase GcvT [Saprospiraceae bacterium]|nr:glycine cleavage system aminomethyltransferase GcvT [Saprospiraceae bacterium]
MKSTALTQKHIAKGAKMAEFAGFNMPISYSGIKEEHQTVREAVGVFDVSHMGEFVLKGEHALDLIQRVTSNDASKLVPGRAQYTCLPNKNGGIVDDLLIYHLEDGNYMLVVNASNIQKDWNWIKAQNTKGVDMVNISSTTSLLAVQGPKAAEALQSLTDIDLANMKFYSFQKGEFAGLKNVLISATGYTGSGGFEIYFKNDYAPVIWEAILEAGAPFGIQPIGLGARDTLRLEMGYCLYGNDIDENTSPIEAGLSWITKVKKATPFNSQTIFAQQKAEGVRQKLVPFVLLDRGIARHGYEVVDESGTAIGRVTSGTMSPSLSQAIGLAYVPAELADPGTELFIAIRNKQVKAVVSELPFYKA